MDEVSKKQSGPEQSGVLQPAKLRALLVFVRGRFEEMGLVAQRECAHHLRFGLRLGGRADEGAGAIDHHAQETGGRRLGSHPLHESFREGVRLLRGPLRADTSNIDAMDETDAGIALGAELPLRQHLGGWGSFLGRIKGAVRRHH